MSKKRSAHRRHSLLAPQFLRPADAAAFHLGYSPYQLWYEFAHEQREEPSAECQRWLQDLPAMLAKSCSEHTLQRYTATLGELLELFTTQPRSVLVDAANPTRKEEPPEILEARARAEMEKVLGRPARPPAPPTRKSKPSAADLEEVFEDQPADEAENLPNAVSCANPSAADTELVETVPDRPNDTADSAAVDWPERSFFLFEQRMSQVSLHGHALIRLASAIGTELPVHRRPWFRLGQTLGHCLSFLTREYDGPAVNVRQEIQSALGGTDFAADAETIPDVSHAAYPDRRKKDSGPTSEGYLIWAYEGVSALVAEVDKYLMREPSISLHPALNFMWFLGNYVKLTTAECDLLLYVAQSTSVVVSRYGILNDALDNPPDNDSPDACRKADQWLIQILDKIVAALQASESPYFKGDADRTRRWLRAEFLCSSRGVGWQRGPLFARLVLK